jgi:hypothetical protein
MGVPVAFELAVLAAAAVVLLDPDAALELEELLLELPQPAAISAASANVSDKAFTLMSLSSCASTCPRYRVREGYHSIRQPDVKFASASRSQRPGSFSGSLIHCCATCTPLEFELE